MTGISVYHGGKFQSRLHFLHVIGKESATQGLPLPQWEDQLTVRRPADNLRNLSTESCRWRKSMQSLRQRQSHVLLSVTSDLLHVWGMTWSAFCSLPSSSHSTVLPSSTGSGLLLWWSKHSTRGQGTWTSAICSSSSSQRLESIPHITANWTRSLLSPYPLLEMLFLMLSNFIK